MNLEALISRLKQKQVDIALEAMGSQQDRGLYQCGREAGVVQGLETALEVINELLNEERKRDPDLSDDSGEIHGKSPYF